jgi:hypothetical protein
MDNLVWDPARLTLVVCKDPLCRGPGHESIACWHAAVWHRSPRGNALWYRRRLSEHQIPAIDSRSPRFAQPRDDAQDVSGECRSQELDLMTPGHEDATQPLQPLQIEAEKRRMVDCGLFHIIEIRRIIDVAE